MEFFISKYLPAIFALIILVAAAVIDLRVQKIPNILTFPSMLIAIGYHTIFNGLEGVLFSISGLLLGIALLIIPYLLGGMGAGDAKLMGAVGAVVGPKGVCYAAVLSALAGGIYAVVLMIVRRDQFKGFINQFYLKMKLFLITRKYTPESRNPSAPRLCYGLAIAVGSISYLVLNISGYAFPL